MQFYFLLNWQLECSKVSILQAAVSYGVLRNTISDGKIFEKKNC